MTVNGDSCLESMEDPYFHASCIKDLVTTVIWTRDLHSSDTEAGKENHAVLIPELKTDVMTGRLPRAGMVTASPNACKGSLLFESKETY